MKNFWPRRSDAKGFSIENLARKYREKIYSVSSKEKTNQLLDDMNSRSTKEDYKFLSTSHLSIKSGHWANRDFSEYKDKCTDISVYELACTLSHLKAIETAHNNGDEYDMLMYDGSYWATSNTHPTRLEFTIEGIISSNQHEFRRIGARAPFTFGGGTVASDVVNEREVGGILP